MEVLTDQSMAVWGRARLRRERPSTAIFDLHSSSMASFLSDLTLEQQQMLYDQGESLGAWCCGVSWADHRVPLLPSAGFFLVRDVPRGSIAGIDGR